MHQCCFFFLLVQMDIYNLWYLWTHLSENVYSLYKREVTLLSTFHWYIITAPLLKYLFLYWVLTYKMTFFCNPNHF